MADYETPHVPPTTPPVVNPDVKPKTSAEMEEDGEAEGETLDHRDTPDEIDIETEKALKPAMDGGRDGKGEQGLDVSRSETLLPPD